MALTDTFGDAGGPTEAALVDHELSKVVFEIGAPSGFRARCSCGWSAGPFETPDRAKRRWVDHGGAGRTLERDPSAPLGVSMRSW